MHGAGACFPHTPTDFCQTGADRIRALRRKTGKSRRCLSTDFSAGFSLLLILAGTDSSSLAAVRQTHKNESEPHTQYGDFNI